jgi:[ribosomal protein S18]-alanine N-acetyltransferase
MVTSYSLRTVEARDADEIYRVIQESEAHRAAHAGPPTGPHWTKSQTAEECRQAHGWVSLCDNRIDAFVLYRDQGAAWEISFLATSPAARGQGLMRDLIMKLKAELPLDKEIWLEVHELNLPARRLYEKVAFQKTGQRPRYYSDGGSAVLYTFKNNGEPPSGSSSSVLGAPVQLGTRHRKSNRN